MKSQISNYHLLFLAFVGVNSDDGLFLALRKLCTSTACPIFAASKTSSTFRGVRLSGFASFVFRDARTAELKASHDCPFWRPGTVYA